MQLAGAIDAACSRPNRRKKLLPGAAIKHSTKI
jgi:hypothetical protein